MHKGRVVFGAMDEVIFGTPPPPRPSSRKSTGCGATSAFLMVSGTLNRETDEIEKIRRRSARAAPARSTRCRRTRRARR